MKTFLLYIIYVFVSFIILPAIITFIYKGSNTENYYETIIQEPSNEILEFDTENTIEIFDNLMLLNSKNGQVEYISLEDYVVGVVAAEMPALFELEALKAQAVAARTYAVRHIDPYQVHIDLNSLGQVYLSIQEMQQRWGDNFDIYYDKISYAVNSTSGQLIWYDYEPIVAVFHATSSGYTEYSSDVWQSQRPYLVSVDSSFDENVPGFISETIFHEEEFKNIISNRYLNIEFSNDRVINQISINERTGGGAVKSITVGNITMAGTELRSVLGLRSSNFTVREEGNNIIFTTRGHGHGAGMSQTGANFLAQEGYTYEEILLYYYQGVSIW